MLSYWKLPSKWSDDLQDKKALSNLQVVSHRTYLVHMPSPRLPPPQKKNASDTNL